MLRSRFLIAGCALAPILLVGTSTQAATFYVTTADDSGPGSLREAITLAEGNGEADEILLGLHTVVLASSLPEIFTEITITGEGWAHSVIDGNQTVSAFTVRSTGNLTLDGVNVVNCFGGGAYVDGGQLSVLDSRFADNSAGYGGAITGQGGTLTLRDSSFVGNTAMGAGAIAVNTGDLDAGGCTFAANTATGGEFVGWGGAIGVKWSSGSQITLTNCTLSGNHSNWRGGGLYVEGAVMVALTGVTFCGNTAADVGDGIQVDDGSAAVTMTHCVVGDGCYCGGGGAVTTLGYNLDVGNSCGFDPQLHDLLYTDPELGPLQANGGPTETHALPDTSPAVDAGSLSCGLDTDQRGFPRPVDGDDDDIAACDIGSVEYQPTLFDDGFESGSTSAWSSTVGG